MVDDPLHILIVEARFYGDLADELRAGAAAALTSAGAGHDVAQVPGALEIPAAIAFAEEAGRRPAGTRYDGFVALGTVIRGETYHFEIVSNEAARGLTDLAIGKRLAIGNGVLTAETVEQAWTRARREEGDKGGSAARACLAMIALRRRLMEGGR